MPAIRGGKKRAHKDDYQAYCHAMMASGQSNDADGRWGKPANGRLEHDADTAMRNTSVNQHRNERAGVKRKHSLQTRSWSDVIALNHRLHPEVYNSRP